MRNIAILLLLSTLAFASCKSDKGGNESPTTDSKKPSKVDTNVKYRSAHPDNRVAHLETNHGSIFVELFEQRAPLTTGNFVSLIEKGFYTGLTFHRVIPDFMIQGGCPNGNGSGDPGYSIKDEIHPELTHSKAGILSMANAGPNTGGSQFFITLKETTYLDGRHAVFGQVLKGQNVVFNIGNVKKGAADKPVETVIIEKISLINQSELP